MKRFFVIIFSILIFGSVVAQNTADIGIWGGIGSYMGDMTQVNNASSLNPNVGFFFRYNFNSRISLRTSAMLGPIGAEGEYESELWDFNKFVTDFSLMGELNFFKYIIGSKRYSWTTYLMGGIGTSIYNYTYDPDRMRPMVYYLKTGQRDAMPPEVWSELLSGKENMVIGLNIPVGFGFKFNIGERFGIGVEAILRKYFNDKMDDLDDPRKFYTTTETDDYGNPVNGYWSGYNDILHNNDFTIHFGVHLTYRFFQGNRECPVYENIN